MIARCTSMVTPLSLDMQRKLARLNKFVYRNRRDYNVWLRLKETKKTIKTIFHINLMNIAEKDYLLLSISIIRIPIFRYPMQFRIPDSDSGFRTCVV